MIRERAILNENLIAIMAQEYRTQSNMTPEDFLETFVHYIGDQDSMLRADLMAPVFKTFGENDETFSDTEAVAIIERLTGPENLRYDITDGGPSLTFNRSYSALVVACLLWRQQQKPFMTAVQLAKINERLKPSFMTYGVA